MKKALVVYSGGLDSTVLLNEAYFTYDKVEALTFNYGSKHNNKEVMCAIQQCYALNITHTIIPLSFIKQYFKSALVENSRDIPHGHYAAENMKSTVVPFRNGIMLSIAAGFAESRGLDEVLLASHSGDHYIYPDCRPEFNAAMINAINEGTDYKVELKFPFESLYKWDIVKIGAGLNVDFSKTYSCYEGGEKPCGKCGTCVERAEAFKNAGVDDPLV